MLSGYVSKAPLYSETLKQVQWGKNKEDDKLPQINLLLVFGEKSGLPFYYGKLAGNILDSKTVKHLLEDLDILGFGKTKFVMDRGFYSENNINGLYRVISSRINAVSTSITTTASKKVLMTSRLSISGSLSFSQSCRKANLSRSIRKPMRSSLK